MKELAMSPSDDFFAPPPFRPEAALQNLARELRAAGLTAREGRFERRGVALVRAALSEDGQAIRAAVVKQPARSPEWQERSLHDAAQVRDFIAEVKKKLAAWSDRDD
jgi:hypothetical protein